MNYVAWCSKSARLLVRDRLGSNCVRKFSARILLGSKVARNFSARNVILIENDRIEMLEHLKFLLVHIPSICTFGFRDLHKKLFYLDLDTKEIRKYFFHELSCVYFFPKSYIYSNFHDICHNLNKNPKTMNRCLHIWMYLAWKQELYFSSVHYIGFSTLNFCVLSKSRNWFHI